MIVGIGTDIVRTARFSEILRRSPHFLNRLIKKILHPSDEVSDPTRQLASAWAAKEALYKSLGAEDQRVCRFNQWRKVWRNGRFEMVSDHPRSDEFLVSISHDGEYTIAMVVRQMK